MEPTVVNARFTGNARREFYKGEEYLVAPLTLIVPGVLPGSQGPLYYPPREIRNSVGTWNVPITLYHPFKNGQHVSAKTPGIWEAQGLGFVKGDSANPSLKAEGWFHVNRTRQLDKRVYEALINNRPMEISTGLFTDNLEPPGGYGVSPNGIPYQAVATNYKPDHVAILPDQVGACSVQDGCGLNVNSGFESDEQRKAFFGHLQDQHSPDAGKYPHLAHLMNGQEVHSEGHGKAEAKAKISQLRSQGIYASALQDPKRPRGKGYMVMVPRGTRLSSNVNCRCSEDPSKPQCPT